MSTHVGVVREENQDNHGHFHQHDTDLDDEFGELYIVADGMGGHRAGRLASELAVKTVSGVYFATQTGTISERLQTAFRSANDTIYKESMSDSAHAGMGTTCVALVLKDNRAFIGHIGDSRAYRINRNRIVQLTNDHTKVAEMYRRGILTQEEIVTHPERHHLYRALGVRPEAEVDILSDISISTKEFFLLCSDGLYEYLSDEEMKQIVLSKPPQIACDVMIHLANERGGVDNSTVCVVRVDYSTSFLDRLGWWEQ
ncbi:MAG: Stp1/IreP family PP2C-type Ser/Thr phosphatase [Bacteroidota bacterium]|jgi:protein phosphatase